MEAATRPRAVEDLPIWSDGPPLVGPTLRFLDDPHTYFVRPYRELGPVFRTRFLGREHVVLAGLEANEFCFENGHLFDYAAVLPHFRDAFGPKGLTQIEGDEHKQKRKRMAAGLRPRTLSGQAPAMVAILRRLLDQRVGETVEVTELAKDLITSIQGRAVFHEDLPDGIPQAIGWLETRLLGATFVGRLRHAVFAMPGYVRRTRMLEDFLGDVVDRHLAGELGDGTDMLSGMLRNLEPDDPDIDRQELIWDLKESLFAGAETSTSVLFWALILCWLHPEWLAELRTELDGFELDEFGVVTDHPNLMATTIEVERLRPPGTIFPRVPRQDFSFGGVTIPKEARVLHVMGVTHYLDEIYDDPLAFRPRRFIERRDYPRHAHTVFGGGAHICLGQPLARFEVALAMATVIRDYELEFLAAPSGRSRSSAAVTVPTEKSLPVRITRRNP